MIAKMMLLLLGGTPAVWNTCMVFFQAMLLAGYLYAHASTRWLRVQHQAVLHITLLVASCLALPIAVAAQHNEPPATGTPIGWLLSVLLITVGIPFFLVSSSGPLLQRWFARTDHPRARDPYFLSVAGNIGSIFALLAYPVLLEPSLRLAQQSSIWTSGYVVLVLLTAACFYLAYRQSSAHGTAADGPAADATPDAHVAAPGWKARLHWIALSFVPSSLLLGVTTFLTTDVAAVPLLWIVPLVIYLLSFVLVFARRTLVPHALMMRMLPLWVLPLAWLTSFDSNFPVVIQGTFHLLTFFFAAMVCHGELAQRRPDGRYLTEFYLCMSVGGVLGGMFNALLAPVIFTAVVEYPLALVLACALRPGRSDVKTRLSRGLDLALPIAVGAFALCMMFFMNAAGATAASTVVLVFVVPSVVCFSFSARPLRFALSVGALMLAAGTYAAAQEEITHRGRSFFGVHRVFDRPEQNIRLLVHGGIIHGVQHLDASQRREPTMYYHRTGPIGQILTALDARPDKDSIGVIGLGIGTLAAYGKAGQQWTFFEIDPAIADLASDPRRFTYLSDSPARTRIVLGDARIALEKEPRGSFDVLVIDAFSSDAIPVHLLTREALQLYLEKLDAGGMIAFHISNNFLTLAPLVANLARDAGLLCLERYDVQGQSVSMGKATAQWVVMARSAEGLGPLAHDPRWRPVSAQSALAAWTDDFSNPLSVVRWFGN
jgi:spermidine synthase